MECAMPTEQSLVISRNEMELILDALVDAVKADWDEPFKPCKIHKTGSRGGWTCDPVDGWHYEESSGRIFLD